MLQEALFDRREDRRHLSGSRCGGTSDRLEIVDLLEEIGREVVAVAFPKLRTTPIGTGEHTTAVRRSTLTFPIAVTSEVLDTLAHGVVEGDLLSNGNLTHGDERYGRASKAGVGIARVVRVISRLGVPMKRAQFADEKHHQATESIQTKKYDVCGNVPVWTVENQFWARNHIRRH